MVLDRGCGPGLRVYVGMPLSKGTSHQLNAIGSPHVSVNTDRMRLHSIAIWLVE